MHSTVKVIGVLEFGKFDLLHGFVVSNLRDFCDLRNKRAEAVGHATRSFIDEKSYGSTRVRHPVLHGRLPVLPSLYDSGFAGFHNSFPLFIPGFLCLVSLPCKIDQEMFHHQAQPYDQDARYIGYLGWPITTTTFIQRVRCRFATATRANESFDGLSYADLFMMSCRTTR